MSVDPERGEQPEIRVVECRHNIAIAGAGYCFLCEEREAGRREGRAESAEIARLFSKFGRDKQSDSKLEDIRAGHVLSALSIAEHLDGLAAGVRIHGACPGCDLIELFEAKMARERGSPGSG